MRLISEIKSRTDLRKLILKEKLIPYQCKLCGLNPEWNGSVLTLQLDHINGQGADNRLENLRFLCPNCHSQTPTYARAKRKTLVSYKSISPSVMSSIDGCSSVRELLQKLGASEHGANYAKIYRVFELNKDDPRVEQFWERQGVLKLRPKYHARKVSNRPNKEELEKLIQLYPLTIIAKQFNLKSGNSIKKWCQAYGIPMHPVGYWTKIKSGKV